MERRRQSETWLPAASAGALRQRAALLAEIRAFFAGRDVLEVETPVLSAAGNSDPGIGQFAIANPALWLRTSPEYAMKRLLAAGSGDIYELGRVFRSGESGRHHNCEFTMLEWYRTGWDYLRLAEEAMELVRHCLPGRALRETVISYRDLFLSGTGLDPFTAAQGELRAFVRAKGLDAPDLPRQATLDLVISHFVQPSLPPDGLTLVHDYPPEQAALARIRAGDPPVAERFELFLGQFELANGYQELTDAAEQEARFRAENMQRERRGEAPVPLDGNLLAALGAGLPECAGVALGVDRLLMARLGASRLDEVLAFPAGIA